MIIYNIYIYMYTNVESENLFVPLLGLYQGLAQRRQSSSSSARRQRYGNGVADFYLFVGEILQIWRTF